MSDDKLPKRPWHYEPVSESVADADGHLVADVIAGEVAGHLLAASPDLLEACERALEVLESAGEPSVDAARLRTAISKARGETA